VGIRSFRGTSTPEQIDHGSPAEGEDGKTHEGIGLAQLEIVPLRCTVTASESTTRGSTGAPRDSSLAMDRGRRVARMSHPEADPPQVARGVQHSRAQFGARQSPGSRSDARPHAWLERGQLVARPRLPVTCGLPMGSGRE
jgi:hypothetical protein